MLLNVNQQNIDFTPKQVKSISKTKVKNKSNEENKEQLKAIYNNKDNKFYVNINNIDYEIKILNINIDYLFSTPANNTYPEWTCKRTFKKRKFEDTLSSYWTCLYNGMPIRGLISKTYFILDVIFYKKQCTKKYNEDIKRIT